VANSARSQMAEGIARHLAGRLQPALAAGYSFASAGSRPTSIRPEAQAVLAEIGIATDGQYAKDVRDIPPRGIDAVITLCAEEECPVFPGDVLRLHWGLPDPASEEGTLEERLPAFRAVRDELLRRLQVVLAGEDG